MSIVELSLLVIAACNVFVVMRLMSAQRRVQRLAERGEPLLAEARRILDDLGRFTRNLEGMSRTARRLEDRVAETATRVFDEIEPPIRNLAAVIAGVRAGVGNFFDSGRNHRNNHQPRISEGVEPTRRT